MVGLTETFSDKLQRRHAAFLVVILVWLFKAHAARPVLEGCDPSAQYGRQFGIGHYLRRTFRVGHGLRSLLFEIAECSPSRQKDRPSAVNCQR